MGRGLSAMAAAREAVRLAPSMHLCHFVLAEAAVEAGRLEDARAAAARAVALAPDASDGYQVQGRVALREECWDEAVSMYRKALSLEPDSSESLNNLGVALQGKGRWREALRHYGEAARINPQGQVAPGNIVNLMQGSPHMRLRAAVLRVMVIPQIGVFLVAVVLVFLTAERWVRYQRMRRTLRGVLSPLALRVLDRRVRAVSPLWSPALVLFGATCGTCLGTRDWLDGRPSSGLGAVVALLVGLGALVILLRRIDARGGVRGLRRARAQ
jgi:tetratricopeptide (TPR) repeat protein